jgi:hypothetical protein
MKLYSMAGAGSLLPHIVLHEAASPIDAIKVDDQTKTLEVGTVL